MADIVSSIVNLVTSLIGSVLNVAQGFVGVLMAFVNTFVGAFYHSEMQCFGVLTCPRKDLVVSIFSAVSSFVLANASLIILIVVGLVIYQALQGNRRTGAKAKKVR